MEHIKDKDKLWIVAYICVKGVPKATAYQRLAEFRNYYKFDGSVNMIIVPVEEPTRIEFYNLEKAEPTSIEKLKELMNYNKKEEL
jgi:hypothetical protein